MGIDPSLSDLDTLNQYSDGEYTVNIDATGWEELYADKVRSAGKYAFRYTHLAGGSQTGSSGIIPATVTTVGTTLEDKYNAFEYRNHARIYTNKA